MARPNVEDFKILRGDVLSRIFRDPQSGMFVEVWFNTNNGKILNVRCFKDKTFKGPLKLRIEGAVYKDFHNIPTASDIAPLLASEDELIRVNSVSSLKELESYDVSKSHLELLIERLIRALELKEQTLELLKDFFTKSPDRRRVRLNIYKYSRRLWQHEPTQRVVSKLAYQVVAKKLNSKKKAEL